MAVIPDVSSPPQVAARGAIRNRNHDLEATIEAGGEFLWTLPDIEMTTGPFSYPPLAPVAVNPIARLPLSCKLIFTVLATDLAAMYASRRLFDVQTIQVLERRPSGEITAKRTGLPGPTVV